MSAFDLDAKVEEMTPRILDELTRYLEIPSISADPDHIEDVAAASKYAADKLESLGFDVSVETVEGAKPGHPVVFAERIVDPTLRTVVFYGHSDVQPVNPNDLHLWNVNGEQLDPFSPIVCSGRDIDVDSDASHIVARGATDDKGQNYTHFAGVEAFLSNPELRDRVNIRFVIEAEEECHGNSVELAVQSSDTAARLQGSMLIVSDCKTLQHGYAGLTDTLRGIHIAKVGTQTPEELVRVINSAFDPVTGKVQLDGFYDGVEDRHLNTLLDEGLSAEHGKEFQGRIRNEAGFSPAESHTVRPTFTPLHFDYANPHPEIQEGLKSVHIQVEGGRRDLHSGEYGGAAPEPGRELMNILGGMLDQDLEFHIDMLNHGSRIQSTNIQRTAQAQITYNPGSESAITGAIDSLCDTYGFDRSSITITDVDDRTAYLRTGDDPASGFTDEGCAPTSMISSRLVPNQTAQENFLDPLTSLVASITSSTPEEVSVEDLGGGAPFGTDKGSPMYDIVREAMIKGYGLEAGQEPHLLNEGGSIPLIPILQEALDIPTYLVGVGTPDGRLHSHLENIGIETGIVPGIKTMYYILEGAALHPAA